MGNILRLRGAPVKLDTIYRRIWFDGSNWRLIGYAHDYIA